MSSTMSGSPRTRSGLPESAIPSIPPSSGDSTALTVAPFSERCLNRSRATLTTVCRSLALSRSWPGMKKPAASRGPSSSNLRPAVTKACSGS
ncbi:MAG: hypothetical protein BWX47_01231 [candidate division Hyd24-12 bacterium ADurb.Bin004]|nr:MAG: hypothetical protein BWX47_01231 [candidate division Hyd24-12 bacterium ADurb.Bin004]